jgi:hypothetical protein
VRQGAPEGLVSCHRNDTLIPTGRSGNRDAQVFTRNTLSIIILLLGQLQVVVCVYIGGLFCIKMGDILEYILK